MADLVNKSNQNNHASVDRMESAARANVFLRIISEYRLYAQRFASLPTWDVLNFLNKLENELLNWYKKEVTDGEKDRIRNEYFLLTHKKPFGGWSVAEIKEKIKEFNEGNKPKMSENYLATNKKNQWKKAMKK